MQKNNHSGFSMMEVMVGLGMFGILTFAFVQYQKSSITTQKKNDIQNALSSVESRIITQLSVRDACNQTFISVGNIVNQKKPGEAKNISNFVAKNPTTGTAYTVIKKGDAIDTKNLLVFDRIDQTSAATEDELIFYFKHIKTNQEYSKKFKIALTTNLNGTIKGCTGKSEAELQQVKNEAVEQAVNLACSNAGGSIQPDGTCKVATAESEKVEAEKIDTKLICDGSQCFTVDDIEKLKTRIATLEAAKPSTDNSVAVATCLSKNVTYDSTTGSCTTTCTTAGYIYDPSQERCDPDTKSLRCIIAKGTWNSTDQSCEFIGLTTCPSNVGSIYKYHYKSSSSTNNPFVCNSTYPSETTWRNNVICTIPTGWYIATPTCQYEIPVSDCKNAQCSMYGCSHTPANCTPVYNDMISRCSVRSPLQTFSAPSSTLDGVSCR